MTTKTTVPVTTDDVLATDRPMALAPLAETRAWERPVPVAGWHSSKPFQATHMHQRQFTYESPASANAMSNVEYWPKVHASMPVARYT